jgi:uncharacterized protein (TIGR02646 family)
MRGIRKRWLPANVSADGQAPSSLQQAEQAFLGSLAVATDRTAHARTKFGDLDKSKLRSVLYEEQRCICVYCERRVEEGADTPPVEHWIPLGDQPQRALHWENLYVSCPTQGVCDDAKGGHRLAWDAADPSLPWPTQQAYENWVGFTSGGEIFVRSDALLGAAARRALELAIEDRPDGGRTRKSILNLNHPALIAARKAAVDTERSRIERRFPGQRAPAAERANRAAQILAAVPYPPFVSVRVAWLTKTLGRGRP